NGGFVNKIQGIRLSVAKIHRHVFENPGWIANKYKNDDRVVILRFRDFKKVILEKTLLDAICNELGCEDVNLDNKILILDGFDEMKALNVRDVLLDTLFNDIKDFDNFKCIITSRLGYINAYQFHSILKLKEFDIKRVEDFVKIITGDVLQKRERIEPNLEVLGIPVILYMAIMSNIDISENPTKPELYNRIFAEKGGIFDRFYDGEVEYSKGKQILRKPANIIKYLEFLQEVAFKMFEKGDLSLKEEEYQVPELEFQGDLVSILEFPIKYLFEKTVYNIEFIHKSIYEYFVAEYIFTSLFKVINESKQSVAGVLGKILPKRLISSEVLEFLAYKIKKTELNYKFDIIINAFQLMLQDGMTYYTSECYKNAIECEMQVFANMLEILHLWNNEPLEFISPIINYIEYNKKLHLNLAYVNLKNKNLVGVNLNEANLKNANLGSSELNEIKLCKSNLVGTNLKMAKLNNSKLSNANLKNADLCGASLCDVDFENADLSDADLTYTNLKRANLKNANLSNADLSAAVLTAANLSGINLCNAKLRGAELDEKQVISLEKIYNLQGVKIYLNETKEKIDYKEFCNRRILVK
ncbi:pentapeptide repeat-containing protein, partial [Parablautia muri]